MNKPKESEEIPMGFSKLIQSNSAYIFWRPHSRLFVRFHFSKRFPWIRIQIAWYRSHDYYDQWEMWG